ncbi:MAG: HEAT repeat domain-containing protein [Lyngbya sp.]|nr:HEAT repeat domain-containing protein [Lyngbya sp.]
MIEMNPQNEINPEKTYALVVGVEKYQEGAKNLKGPARDAVQFAIWLLSKNVNPNNIGLFISPLEEENLIQEAQEQEKKFNQIPRNSATFENIESFIDQQLHNQSQSGDLLYVFWSGHGLITPSQEQTETRLLFSDFSNSSPRNLNLSSLVNALKFTQKHKGFSRQIYLIDACADVYISNQFQVKEMRFSPFGMKDKLQPRQQYILFSVTEGATAINKKSEGGSFSQAIFEELKHQPLLPDMERVSTKVINKLEIDGMNPTFWKRDWDGNDENNLGNLLSDSDTPTPEEQKNAVLNFLEKIEEKCKDIKLFHLEQKIPLTQQYIPIQVTLERRYKKLTENIGSYAESEAEWKQIHALKGTIEQYKKQQLDWEEARKKHQKIMVLADPGMGKSTLLKMEALRIAKDQREKLETGTITVEEVVLPLFLRLSELASEQNKSEFIPEAIADVIKQIYLDKTEFEKIQPLIVEKIKKGQCFLLLDAWDEVQQDYRTNLKNKLDNLKKIDFPIIATSRIVGYTGSPIGGAKEVEIVPFDQQQTENYIKTWFKNAKRYLEDESVSAENLIKELEDRPQINELVKNPFLLSLICSLYQTKKLELPTKRSEIYKQAVDCMLKEWRNQRKEQNTVDIDFKKEVLESFAYQISREGKEVFNLRELRKKIQSFLQKEGYSHVDPMAIITELSEEDGIIQQIDKDGEKYIFLHRTFQEYFTASYLNQSEDTLSLAEQFFWNYDQHETLTLLAGLMDDPTCLIEDIYTREDDIFKTPLLLAGRCLAECSNQALEPSLTTDIGENLHQFWLSYPDASFINSTVVTLAKVNSEAVKPLIAALHHSYLYVRRSAVEVLGHIGNGEALKALIAALHDPDYNVRRSAVEALGKIGNAEAVKPLIAALHDSNYWVTRSAVEALCQIGNVEAVQLFTAALHDPDYNLRKYAVEALGEIGNAEAVKPLIAALNHSDSEVRRYAAFGLGKIGNAEAVKPLIAALDDSDHYVRRSAASALGKIGNGEEAVKLLIAALDDPNNNVRTYAVEALGEIRNAEAVKLLIAALDDPNNNVRSSAASALCKIGNGEALKALIAALDDPDSFVRRYAAEALCKIGNGEALKALIAALDDPYVLVRRYAVEALCKIGNAEAVQPLIAALNDPDDDVRRSAVHALGEIGNAEAVKPLIATLHHSDSLVRWSAVHALGEIGNGEAVKPLIAALHDPSNNVRKYAVFALGKIGNGEALKALIAALNHSDSEVRRSAVFALGKIGNAEALKALIAALDHPDSNVRSSAAYALGKIGNAEAVKPLIAALNDSDEDVRRDAIEALGKIGNAEAVQALIAAPNHSDFYMYVIMYPVEALGKIGNAEVVKALIAALHDSDLYVRRNAASALGEIGNAEAVEALIAALHDSDIFLVRKFAAYALGEIGTAEVLEQLLQDRKVNIYKPELFYMARRIAIRFSQKNYEFIPVYPKYVKSGN